MQSLDEILGYLRRNGYRDAEKTLMREAQLMEGRNSMTEELLAVKMSSDDEPLQFCEKYSELLTFIENALDIYKMELALLLYPVFVQLYLRLVAGSHLSESQEFMTRFGPQQESIYQKDVSSLELIRTPNDLGVGNEEMRRSEEALHESEHLFRQFHRSSFGVSMSRETYDYLQRHFLRQRALQTIHSIITEHLDIEVFDGPPRNQLLLESRRGAFFGESSHNHNRVKVFHGPLREPDHAGGRPGAGGGGAGGAGGAAGPGEAGDGEDEAESGASRRKKARRDGQSTPNKAGTGAGKGALDANAPSWDRVPLPLLKDADRVERRNRQRDLERRVRLGPQTLPPVCFYTIANASSRGGCPVATFTEDGTKMAAGFEDGNIRLWSLTREPLRSLRPVADLERLSCDDPRITERMLSADEPANGADGGHGGHGGPSGGADPSGDGSSAPFERQLVGHEGAVYGLDFSPDRQLLLSGGCDGNVRLWSLLTHSCLWVRREHRLPVWCVACGPHGHYLASGGQDGLARIWSTDHNASLRLFSGHWSDVTAVEFHPNSNYLVTGSDDRGVRLFDLRDGKCARLFCGHKGSPQTITFSPCGRYIVSGCDAGQVCVWDIPTGHQVAYLRAHVQGRGTTAVQLCRDGNLLATAGLDGSLRMWDFRNIVSEHGTKKASGAGLHHSSVLLDVKASTQALLASYYTKKTPFLSLNFNRCNVLLGCGPFGQE